MKAIIFATTEEAGPFTDRFRRGRFSAVAEGDTVHDDEILVTVVGVGKIKAALRTERLLLMHEVTSVLHAGTCTALRDEFEVGSAVAVQQVLEGDRIELSTPAYPRMPLGPPDLDVPTGTLVTQDHAISDEQELTYWQRIADVSDTTGYAVSYVAATHGIPCQILKVVTGRTGLDDPQLRKTLSKAYRTLADTLIELLESA